MSRRFWTTTELATIRKHYSTGGVMECLVHLPWRSRQAIYQQARLMGLKAPGVTGVRRYYPQDDHIDQQIRFLHQKPPTKGCVAALARRVGRPQWWISKRARDLGLTTPKFRDPEWSAAELDLLQTTSDLTVERARLRFRAAGFERTATAIAVKRQRAGISRLGDRTGWYRTGELSALLGYCRDQAGRWIAQGLLKCKREGEFRWVSDSQLRDFIVNHPMQIELRRIPAGNQPWFVEMLSGRSPVYAKGDVA